jgi:putative flippase GtrA
MVLSRLPRFALVGTVGFIADACILYGLLSIGVGPFSARLVSFLAAVFVTWQLNRRMTFDVPANNDSIREGFSYLLAMSFGGVLNLMTYTAVISINTTQFWSPALGVAAGSLVGLFVNYSLANKWVFGIKPNYFPSEKLSQREMTWLAIGALQLLFWLGALHSVELPGLYMDAVNPDYLSARTINPEIRNPVNAMPTVWIPLLGNLYHGVQNYYVSLPIVGLLGFNLPAIRIAQGLFGAGIVTMTYLLALRMISTPALAFAAAALLAVDVAFLASFRTQFYIVLSGVFWLLCSFYVAVAGRRDAFGRRAFISGALYGLAVYSYFIFLFFLPVWLILVRSNTQGWRALIHWLIGFCAGMIPYVLGYISLIIALGGPLHALDWLHQSITGLAPLSSKLSLSEGVINTFRNASYALQNTGNELMIFGKSLGSRFTEIKTYWLIAGTALLFFISHGSSKKNHLISPFKSQDGNSFILPHQMVWFPVAFMLTTLAFGSRIWIHHFSILTPLLYLFAMVGFSHWYVGKLKKFILVMLLFIGLLNIYQQTIFFRHLEATGGSGKMSNAQTRLVEDALASSANTVYLFPEWGFFMPFAFLTGNTKPYELDVSAATLQRHLQQGNTVRIAFWNASDELKYRNLLHSHGFQNLEVARFLQRDQQIAFFVITGIP